MTRDDDFIGLLEGYLDEFEGDTRLPDETRFAVRAQLPKTKQIGQTWWPMRYMTMNRPLQVAAAGIVVIAAAALGIGLSRNHVGIGPSPSEYPTQTPQPSQSQASRAPAWIALGDMPGPWGPDVVATLLSDGRALVADGNHAQAALFDPTTRAWRSTGSPLMGVGSLTRLLDGTVLATGGGADGTSAQLYDLATGTWTSTGAMAVGRPGYAITQDLSEWNPSGYTTTLLSDGRVLVAGGAREPFGSSNNIVPNAELYDPVTGRWTPTGSMVFARAGASATLLPDGRVLVAGGEVYQSDGSRSPIDAAEIYDPGAGTWTATASLLSPRAHHAAVLLTDGSVLVMGSEESALVERYDPGTRQWTAAGSTTAVRWDSTATLLPSGEVLVAGGRVLENAGNPSPSAELYDPTTGISVLIAVMPGPRAQHADVLLADGTVLLVGGERDLLTMNWLHSGVLYDPGSAR